MKTTLPRKITLLCLGIATLMSAAAQDIHFSQFFDAPLLRNPSLAGIYTGDIRVQTVYRNQWNSITNAYRTSSLNAEARYAIGETNDFVTTGVQIMYDAAGAAGYRSIHVLPALNYHKSLSEYNNSYLSVGFMAGMVQKSFDPSKMTTNSQYDNMGLGENISKPRYSYFDGSFGASFSSSLRQNRESNLFIGIAYHHFNKPKASFFNDENIRIAPKWVASAGVKIPTSEYAYITVQADYSVQDGFTETIGGLMYGIKLGEDPDNAKYTIHGGAFMRLNDAIIPTAKLDFAPFSVTISYDVNISKLKTSTYGTGGFEVSIGYTGYKKRNPSLHAMMCPVF